MKLWGWLGQHERDPLAGSPAVDPWLARKVGLGRLTPTPPSDFDPVSVPPGRVDDAMRHAIEDVIAADRLSDDPLIRISRSLGQSYPDQLARRAGRVDRLIGLGGTVAEPACTVADMVAAPQSSDDVAGLLAAAARCGFRVMPVGGATSVVGGLSPPDDSRPLVVADMRLMTAVIGMGEGTVTAQAGIGLAALEAQLAAHKRTLGHFPQSFEAATLGGSVMANGSGQRSDGYGRLADTVVSARIATPSGPWSTEAFRHAAGGPWLGGLVAGSEGLFGIMTDVTLRTRAAPELVEDRAWLLPSLADAIGAMRMLQESEAGLAMLRVSDVEETSFLSGFRLARRGRSRPPLAERLVMAAKGAPQNPLLVIAGYEGSAQGGRHAFSEANHALSAAGGVPLGATPGTSWRKSRYEAPHLRESVMARGLGVDTFETAAPWARLEALHGAVTEAIRAAILSTLGGGGGRPIVFAHLSHSYPEGACLYFTAIFPRSDDALGQWRTIKTAATEAILANGGALSHHHGLGADHAPFARREKGDIGLRILSAIRDELDPQRVMATGMAAALPGR